MISGPSNPALSAKNYKSDLEFKGSVKEPNISIYFLFPPITQWCSISNVLLLVEGECQILVF